MLRCNYVASVVMYPLNLRKGASGILYRVVLAKTVNIFNYVTYCCIRESNQHET